MPRSRKRSPQNRERSQMSLKFHGPSYRWNISSQNTCLGISPTNRRSKRTRRHGISRAVDLNLSRKWLLCGVPNSGKATAVYSRIATSRHIIKLHIVTRRIPPQNKFASSILEVGRRIEGIANALGHIGRESLATPS